MADLEINSFIGKFKYLCAAGYTSSLEFKSDDGCVSIFLNSNVGFLTPPTQTPPPNFKRKCRPHRGPSYGRRQQRRRATHELNRCEEQSNSNVTNKSAISRKQAEKLVIVPSNDDEEFEAGLGVLPRDAMTSTNDENITSQEMEAPAAAEADTNSSSPSVEPKALVTSCKATTSTEDFIVSRILTYASQFAKPEYLYPTYEPTCWPLNQRVREFC